ncbi:hypothetical protein QE250_15685 [Chromatiaceae bacterium AAb-1]|nr:hypothetical protein [Chromatiaceae bacterium AAb-1]
MQAITPQTHGKWWLTADLCYLGSFFLLPAFPWLLYWLLPCFVLSLITCWRALLRNDITPLLILLSLLLPWYSAALLQHSPAQDPTLNTSWQRRVYGLLAITALAALLFTTTLQQKLINPALAPLDQAATKVLQRSLLLTSGSFATARLIDRGIAFISEAQVGVGVASFKPGQLLKPLQDMAVRYSDLMVLAMTSVGLQLFLLEFGKVAALPLFGSGILLSTAALLFVSPSLRPAMQTLLRTFVVLLLMSRVIIPLSACALDNLSVWILEPQRIAAETELTNRTTQLQQLDEQPVTDNSGILSWLKQMAAQAGDMAAAVKHFSDNMVEQFIQLIVIYALQTLIFPLLTLWLLWHLGRWCIQQPVPRLQPLQH